LKKSIDIADRIIVPNNFDDKPESIGKGFAPLFGVLVMETLTKRKWVPSRTPHSGVLFTDITDTPFSPHNKEERCKVYTKATYLS
jgi:hypothetical protein